MSAIFLFVKVHESVNIALHRMMLKKNPLNTLGAHVESIRCVRIKRSITIVQHPNAGGIRGESLRVCGRTIRHISTQTHYSHCLLH